MYGYVDPVARVREQQAQMALAHPNWPQYQRQSSAYVEPTPASQYGYVDPVQRVHEQQAQMAMAHPNWPQYQQQPVYVQQPPEPQPEPQYQPQYQGGQAGGLLVVLLPLAIVVAVVVGIVKLVKLIAKRRQRTQQVASAPVQTSAPVEVEHFPHTFEF